MGEHYQKVNFFLLYGFQDLCCGLSFSNQFFNGNTFCFLGFDKLRQLSFGIQKNFFIFFCKGQGSHAPAPETEGIVDGMDNIEFRFIFLSE